jgi:hypothetical protein
MSDAAESRVTDWIQQQQREMMEEDVVPETDPEIIFQNLQVDRIRLKLGSLLQEGTFGRVYQVSSSFRRSKVIPIQCLKCLTFIFEILVLKLDHGLSFTWCFRY